MTARSPQRPAGEQKHWQPVDPARHGALAECGAGDRVGCREDDNRAASSMTGWR